MSFDTTKTSLKDLLAEIDKGKIQLPEFQRDYVWNEGDVRSLIASVAKGFPVGALLLLEQGSAIAFKPRGIEGTNVAGIAPQLLLLDGQQRMTSLYKTIFSRAPARVRTAKGQVVERYFYIRIDDALANPADFENAIETVPSDRVRRVNFDRDVGLDLSSADKEYDQLLFPLNQALNPTQWIFGAVGHWSKNGTDRMADLLQFQAEVLNQIQSYAMPIIRLSRDNSREAVCTVFEKVNVGGKKLDAFELVTAIYAGVNFDLREDWAGTKAAHGRLGRIRSHAPSKGVFADLSATDFLQACTILHTRDVRRSLEAQGKTGKELPPVSCSREALLGLPKDAYCKYADAVEKGFVEAARFLNEQKILWGRDLPYPTQVVALAALFAILPQDQRNAPNYVRLAEWFWSGVLGEFYGSATETKIARDVPELAAWLQSGPAPRTIAETFFQTSRLETLRSRLSAAYKGFHALLMRHGCRDFITGKGVQVMTVYADPLDIHHIFPRKWCEERRIPPALYNSIINKTALSAESNRAIGGDAPSRYLARIEGRTKITAAELDHILATHLIDPAFLRSDDFDGFFRARKAALAELAATAQGKPVVADTSPPEGFADDEGLTVDEEEAIA